MCPDVNVVTSIWSSSIEAAWHPLCSLDAALLHWLEQKATSRHTSHMTRFINNGTLQVKHFNSEGEIPGLAGAATFFHQIFANVDSEYLWKGCITHQHCRFVSIWWCFRVDKGIRILPRQQTGTTSFTPEASHAM